MPHKNLNDLNFVALILTFIFGLTGGVLNYMRRLKTYPEYTKTKKIVMFFVDVFTVGSLTIIVFIGLQGYGVNELLSVAIAGFVGHQGTRAIYLLEIVALEKLGSKEALNIVKEEHKNDK